MITVYKYIEVNTGEGEELFKPEDKCWHKNKWVLE